ncbi:MAG: HNH endonuclease signature motif containing protein [Erysipelotrichaceae bacterium]
MKVTYIKSILCMLDEIENDGFDLKTTTNLIYQKTKNENFIITITEVETLMQYFFSNKLLKDTSLGYDLLPLVTIYGHSNYQSNTEALALLSFIIKFNDSIDLMYSNNKEYEIDELEKYFDPITLSLLLKSLLVIENHNKYKINDNFKDDYKNLKSIKDDDNLINEIVLSNYLKDLLSKLTIDEYTNVNTGMIHYDRASLITKILPQNGIIKNRENTQYFQSFYKDCLFNDANHQCQICGVDLPVLLIASHIKPYRDCGHIYETVDYNNGLLLCRNHDYLFDQGYVSFNDDGSIIISSELKNHSNYEIIYNINDNTKLRVDTITHSRKLFLAYHRSHIFKS